FKAPRVTIQLADTKNSGKSPPFLPSTSLVHLCGGTDSGRYCRSLVGVDWIVRCFVETGYGWFFVVLSRWPNGRGRAGNKSRKAVLTCLGGFHTFPPIGGTVSSLRQDDRAHRPRKWLV